MTKISDYLDENRGEFDRWIENHEQGRIDLKILPYLKDIENGYFVEAGALDGLFMSNTKILEDLGWTGLLIEPSPWAYEKCKENRKSEVINCALVSKGYPYTEIDGDFFYDGKDGLGAWSGVKRYSKDGDQLRISARTLDSLLKERNITHIDLFSLDVEGYELNVLKGLDLETVDISYILIEINVVEYGVKDIEDYLKGYLNLGCISNFSHEANPKWNGLHQDFLFKRK